MKKTGASTYVVIWDRTGFSKKNFDLSVMKGVAKLQEYYPERLHAFYVLHSNFLFSVLYSLAKPFLSPRTTSKVSFEN